MQGGIGSKGAHSGHGFRRPVTGGGTWGGAGEGCRWPAVAQRGGVDASVSLLLFFVRGPLFLSSLFFVLGSFVPFSLPFFFHGACFINLALLFCFVFF